MWSTNTLKCLLSNDEKGEYVVPRITIVILCLAALPCGDVISFLCSVRKYIICLAPTIKVVFPSKVYFILHDVQRTWHEDSTMTTGGSCIAIRMDTQAEKCRSQKMGSSCDWQLVYFVDYISSLESIIIISEGEWGKRHRHAQAGCY